MKYKYVYHKTKKEAVEWYETKTGKKLYRVRFKRKINGKNTSYVKGGFKSQAEAVANRDRAMSQINKSGGLNNDKITVAEYWKKYRKNKIGSHLWTPDTARGADYLMNFDILPHYGDMKLDSLTRPEYQTFINYLLYDRTDPKHPDKKRPLSHGSVVLLNRIFQAMINSAADDEIIDHNKIKKITINKEEPTKKKVLTEAEVEQTLIYFKEHYSKLKFAMLYLPILGLRRAEIAGIRYSAVKPYDGGYLLTIASSRPACSPDGKGPKTVSSNRTLFVVGEPAHQLKIALHEYERIARKFDHIPHKDDFIFVDEKDFKPIRVERITWAYRYCGQKLNIQPLHPHMMRHTLATNNAIQGIDRELTAQFLGHKNVETTDYYKEPTLAGKQVVMASINDSFKNANQKLQLGVN